LKINFYLNRIQYKFILICFLSIVTLDAEEISAFGAGDLSSPNPYGLTSVEESVLKNKNKSDKLDTNIKTVNNSLESINERMDGLNTVIEGDSQKLHTTTNTLKTFIEKYNIDIKFLNKNDNNIKLTIDKLSTDQALLLENQEKLTQNMKILNNLQKKLQKVINSINSKYVSDNELKSNKNQFITITEFNRLLISLGKSPIVTKKSQINLMDEANLLYKDHNYTKALSIYNKLLLENYKPAESNYMIGQIYFNTKKYKKSISFFKASALLRDNAWWMPKLLLNSAISLENTNDIDSAASFYNILIEKYPKSKEALEAKNILKIDKGKI
jgi:TolA-binding protein